ncbi:hypothetical protein IAQ61_011181 [Plenodomus lingam]|uniref:uncharacterized protein n=1 Tax=Leptosphaeria maculans TaxID=5022 RepID=UPI00332AE1CB|nr:hypothetical protein IAQ61_011181 [Plenodomus lingam]
MNMLNKGVSPENTKSVVEYSSGSTVISLALASRPNLRPFIWLQSPRYDYPAIATAFLTKPGLLSFLQKRKDAGTLKYLAGSTGLIDCAFICCDLPYQYVDEYFDKLGDKAFHPIHNQVPWELNPTQALESFTNDTTTPPAITLVDLRKPDDFALDHIPGSHNLPLQTANASTPSPFFAAHVLEAQWKELETTFTNERIDAHELSGKNVCVICYNGDTARVATSILRAKGVAANSIKGGIQALRQDLPHLLQSTRGRRTVQPGYKHAANVAVQEVRADSLSPRAWGRTDLDQVVV